jgi:UDP-glucose 4-epimerase
MNILVTGGAGYIGSVAVQQLITQGHHVVVIDNLSKGNKELIHKDATFYEADLIDTEIIRDLFSNHSFDAVIHFAAYKAVGESMTNAVKYSHNIKGVLSILEAMVEHKVKKIIFSSTAAVYGMPKETVLTEESETKPINYYGVTKLTSETILKWYHEIHNIEYIALRYFNVAGDGGLNYIDPDAQNIFPIIMEVLSGKRKELTVFGNDYDTPDGTCIRDYISVRDLVDAHIKALKAEYVGCINLGTGKGCSVLELIKATENVTGKQVPYIVGDRRAGDPAALTASNEKARTILNWTPQEQVEDMLKETWNGYTS